ncbi:MAG TPA: hypothetical protein VM681_09260 [Candidatus Thermoplasmatota archaeon]|nr:hypothetical protein [Candidatus Thermoplasmatota archaeon]
MDACHATPDGHGHEPSLKPHLPGWIPPNFPDFRIAGLVEARDAEAIGDLAIVVAWRLHFSERVGPRP